MTAWLRTLCTHWWLHRHPDTRQILDLPAIEPAPQPPSRSIIAGPQHWSDLSSLSGTLERSQVFFASNFRSTHARLGNDTTIYDAYLSGVERLDAIMDHL